MPLNPTELYQLLDLVNTIPDARKRFGKDAEQIEAFYKDLTERVEAELKGLVPDEKIDTLKKLLQVPVLLGLEGIRGQRDFKVFKPSSFDFLKPMRLRADEIARIFKFERYKALRKL